MRSARHARLSGAPRNSIGQGFGLNLTPMIDVVFQLLIYFLLGASLAQGEEMYRLDLPEREHPRVRTGMSLTLEEAPLTIRVSSQGAERDTYIISVEGPVSGAALQPSTAADLEALLRSAVLSSDHPDGTLTRRHPVLVAPSSNSRWEHAVDVFNAVVRAGFERVNFLPPVQTGPELSEVEP
ncbi:MAG: biopolymer transporter ExbD [Phycisphaerae bacterium]|nr:biopolymer transporter ExbD [Phycisphaerae bacterium]